MQPDNDRPDGVALRTFQAYLYTAGEKDGGKWYYFRRYVDKTAEDAVRRVEGDFKMWAEGQ